MIIQFNQQAGSVPIPQKLVDTGNRWTRVCLQVLDGSTLFIGTNRDTMQQAAAGGLQQGLQIVQGDRIQQLWWKGEMWGVNSVNGGLVDVEVLYVDQGGSMQSCESACE